MVSININFSNKTSYTILALALLLTITRIVYATTYSSIPNPGHGADTIKVTVGGQETTLQDAIDDNLIGGGGGTLSCADVSTGQAGIAPSTICANQGKICTSAFDYDNPYGEWHPFGCGMPSNRAYQVIRCCVII